jgi:hypothetical protein
MADADVNRYWEASFKTLYEAYFQELGSEALIGRWQWIDVVTGYALAATASGSAVTGWALWSSPSGKYFWAGVAGIAGVISIAHRVLTVPTRIKDQEELRQLFTVLRVDCETFRQRLVVGVEAAIADQEYQGLRTRLATSMVRTRPDIAFTKKLRKLVQCDLDRRLGDQIAHN